MEEIPGDGLRRPACKVMFADLYADDLQTALRWPGANVPCPRVRIEGSELLEPETAGPQRMAGQASP